MTKIEFEEAYCKKSNLTLEEYREHFVTLPCRCGENGCKGWACVSNNKNSIKAHMELYC